MKQELLLAQLDASAERERPTDTISDLRDLVNDLLTERTLVMQVIRGLPYSAGTFIHEGDPLETLRSFHSHLLRAAAEAQDVSDELRQRDRDIEAVRRVLGTSHPF